MNSQKKVVHIHLLPGLDATTTNQRRGTNSKAAKKTEQPHSHPVIGIMVVALFALSFLAFLLYIESIPGRTFDSATMAPPEVIQEGLVEKVWISSENGKYYANVQFTAGEKRHRKCTLSTTGLYQSDRAQAIIGKVDDPNSDWETWSYMAMDIGLPATEYWQLRRAAWPFWGERFIEEITILMDD